jgi:hypothetical protein
MRSIVVVDGAAIVGNGSSLQAVIFAPDAAASP